MKAELVIFAVLSLIACNDGGPTGGSTTTTSTTPIQITGSVTTYRFDLTSPGSQYGNISYIVTNHANRQAIGCFVRVNWLDHSGLQVGFTYAATDITIPVGTSTITNQDFVHRDEAARITNSRVEYSNCR